MGIFTTGLFTQEAGGSGGGGNVKSETLLSVTTAPVAPFAAGSEYYDSTAKKIYTASEADTWTGAAESDPEFGTYYVCDGKTYVWDGNSLEAFDLEDYQRKLTAGDNVSISEENVISATDTTYTAGDNVSISEENVISATDTTYTAGSNVSISAENVISANVPEDVIKVSNISNTKNCVLLKEYEDGVIFAPKLTSDDDIAFAGSTIIENSGSIDTEETHFDLPTYKIESDGTEYKGLRYKIGNFASDSWYAGVWAKASSRDAVVFGLAATPDAEPGSFIGNFTNHLVAIRADGQFGASIMDSTPTNDQERFTFSGSYYNQYSSWSYYLLTYDKSYGRMSLYVNGVNWGEINGFTPYNLASTKYGDIYLEVLAKGQLNVQGTQVVRGTLETPTVVPNTLSTPVPTGNYIMVSPTEASYKMACSGGEAAGSGLNVYKNTISGYENLFVSNDCTVNAQYATIEHVANAVGGVVTRNNLSETITAGNNIQLNTVLSSKYAVSNTPLYLPMTRDTYVYSDFDETYKFKNYGNAFSSGGYIYPFDYSYTFASPSFDLSDNAEFTVLGENQAKIYTLIDAGEALTFEAWVKIENIVHGEEPTTAADLRIAVPRSYGDSIYSNECATGIRWNSSSGFTGYAKEKLNMSSTNIVDYATAIDDTAYHHLAVVRYTYEESGETMAKFRFFIDGNLVYETTSGTIAGYISGVYLVADSMKFLVKDIRVSSVARYDSAFTPSKVGWFANAGLSISADVLGAITSADLGFDASKTQVLKNVNGTLTWVDEQQ